MTKIVLDVHVHLITPNAAALAQFDGVSWDPASEKLEVDGHQIGLKGLFRPADLLKWMDDNDVGQAWISVPPPVYRPHLEADAAERWLGLLNDGLARIVQQHPTRLSPLFHLPVEHPELAVAIARDKIATGQVRFSMSAGGVGHVLSAAVYEPLWDVLNKAAGFLFLHPGEGCDARLDPFYLHNLLGNPTETAIATSHLVFAAVLQRYPDFKICLAHAGGTAAALAGRWQQGHATKRPGLDTTHEAPLLALRRFCVDCIAHDDGALRLAAQVFGEDHVLFGSDWPFPMGLMQPHRQLQGLDSEFRKRIFCDSPEELLGKA
ncbi:amidohydrolase family protein [Tardiphaga sp. vice154]|uniref:amidohydrolase family protein n=1 Tax=Tardiphaga sp. vice154 TaxID=2592814 RepID=UPI0011625AA2|nr:amidohydrolase family protein [Tardiphaga sp. vice154]QDM20770.1 amidohydrolase family protein [Tardiphaga sp. vice154]